MATASPMTTSLSREEYDGMTILDLVGVLTEAVKRDNQTNIVTLLSAMLSYESDHTYDQAYEEGYEAGMSEG